MEEPHCSLPLSSLLCNENEASFDEIDELFMKSNNYYYSVSQEEEEEYVQMLFDREKNIDKSVNAFSSLMNQNWFKDARLDAIDWILKTRESFGFRLLTAYLSVTYFDRFLSKRSIDDENPWAIQLLSVACLSLAAKMEECDVPPLSEFCIEEEYNFESKVIQRMELMVLNTLEWRMNSVTPFDYIHYFITKLSDDEFPSMDLVSKSVDFIMSSIEEINSLHHRSSAIAMAAVLAALNKGLTRKMVDVKISVVSSSGLLDNDVVFTCYNIMVELDMEKIKTPKFIVPPNSSSIDSSSTDVNEDSCLTFASRNKRRRLTFHDYDQNKKRRLP